MADLKDGLDHRKAGSRRVVRGAVPASTRLQRSERQPDSPFGSSTKAGASRGKRMERLSGRVQAWAARPRCKKRKRSGTGGFQWPTGQDWDAPRKGRFPDRACHGRNENAAIDLRRLAMGSAETPTDKNALAGRNVAAGKTDSGHGPWRRSFDRKRAISGLASQRPVPVCHYVRGEPCCAPRTRACRIACWLANREDRHG